MNLIEPLYPAVHYRGRFAPSPTGELHLGSLVAALGSFLHSRVQGGEWLVRIEDIDPPREVKHSDVKILRALEAYGLNWDRDVIYQSQRSDSYERVLAWLRSSGRLYECGCTRKSLVDGKHVRGKCVGARNHSAQRFLNLQPVSAFADLRLGWSEFSDETIFEDFIVKRSDGLYAYQLAVVVDDLASGVTHVVRGMDLLPATCWQMTLMQALNMPIPRYLHLPLVTNDLGQKLSKQNLAQPIPTGSQVEILSTLMTALRHLSLRPPDFSGFASPDCLLKWAIDTIRMNLSFLLSA